MGLSDSLRTIFPKILPSVKKADRKIARTTTSKPTDYKEFMFPPLVGGAYHSLLSDKSPFDQFSASREGWRLYFTDPDVTDAIRKNVLKSTQPNKNGHPFEISVDSESVADSDFIYDVMHNVFSSTDVNIYRRASQFAKNMLIEGQSFYRVQIENDRIVGLRKIRGPRSGFKISGPVVDNDGREWFAQIEAASGKIVNVFHGWEVIRFLWDYDDELDCGVPLPVSISLSQSREEKGAEMLKVARHARAWPKKVFEYDGMTEEQFVAAVRAYEESRRNISMEDEAFTDDHTQAKARVLDLSSPSLYQIDDIKFHKNKKMRGLLIPRAFLSAEEAPYPARAVLDVYYDEWVNSTIAAIEQALTGDFEHSGIKKIINLQLILLGRQHWNVPISLEWTSKNRVLKEEAEALDVSEDRGFLSPQTYLSLKHNLDFELELERTAANKKKMQEILGNDDFGAMARGRSNGKDIANPDEVVDDEANKGE